MADTPRDELDEAIDASIKGLEETPYVDWGIALGLCIMRTMEKRDPGFTKAVRAEIETSANRMANSGDEQMERDAPEMQALADSWIFKEDTGAPS